MVSTKAAPRAHRHRVQDPPHAAHMRCPRLFLQTAKFPFFRQRDFLPSGSGVSFPQAAEPLVLYSWNALAAPCSGIAWGCILFRPEELVPPFLTNKLAVWVGNALAARGLYHFCSWIALAALDLYHFCSWIAQVIHMFRTPCKIAFSWKTQNPLLSNAISLFCPRQNSGKKWLQPVESLIPEGFCYRGEKRQIMWAAGPLPTYYGTLYLQD
eukprot:scaffold99494_cov17-Tisochrysis_lutea.AAC.1